MWQWSEEILDEEGKFEYGIASERFLDRDDSFMGCNTNLRWSSDSTLSISRVLEACNVAIGIGKESGWGKRKLSSKDTLIIETLSITFT